MSGRAQFFSPSGDTERFTATVTLTTEFFADLGLVLDAIEAVVRVAPNVTGKVDAEQYTRTFYGWDKTPDEWKSREDQ